MPNSCRTTCPQWNDWGVQNSLKQLSTIIKGMRALNNLYKKTFGTCSADQNTPSFLEVPSKPSFLDISSASGVREGFKDFMSGFSIICQDTSEWTPTMGVAAGFDVIGYESQKSENGHGVSGGLGVEVGFGTDFSENHFGFWGAGIQVGYDYDNYKPVPPATPATTKPVPPATPAPTTSGPPATPAPTTSGPPATRCNDF